MAGKANKKENKEERLNYKAEIAELRKNGALRLYFLWGQEDYLREQYLVQLKKLCLPDGEDSFSYKRLDGPELDIDAFRQAVDAMPFLTERSFVELRNVDLNKLGDADAFRAVIGDIPEYCTVALVQSTQFEPDGRLKAIKAVREKAKELKFSAQSQGLLTDWILRRFAALGKNVELDVPQRLIFISGDLMSRLIPEIEKIAAYTQGDRVTVSDVDAVASHIPEADVFEMTEQISQRRYNAALSILAELLSDKNNEPIMILAILGAQMRKLYTAKLASERGLGTQFVMDTNKIKYEFIAKRLTDAARGYTLPQLRQAVKLCAEADYKMKSSFADNTELLKEVIYRITAGETDAQN